MVRKASDTSLAPTRTTLEAEGPAEWAGYPSTATLAQPPSSRGSFPARPANDMPAFALQVERSSSHVTRGMARVALQQELFRHSMRTKKSVLLRHRFVEESLGCFRQDWCLGQVLPRREFGCMKARTAQPQRNASYTRHLATIRAECGMQRCVSQVDLEGQLAEVATHAMLGQWLSVALMSNEMRLQERLRGGISKAK